MNIDQQLEVVRKALESGAKVDIRMHRLCEENKEEAVKYFAELTNGAEYRENKGYGSYWVKGNASANVQLTVFHNGQFGYMEEDVFLDEKDPCNEQESAS